MKASIFFVLAVVLLVGEFLFSKRHQRFRTSH